MSPADLLAPDSAPVVALAPSETRPHTCARSGIWKSKTYADGTVRYGFLASNGEPNNLSKALVDPNWKQAMDNEYLALLKNETWHLVPTRSNANVIDCKWVYKIKRKPNGTIDKIRLDLLLKDLNNVMA